MSISLQGFGEGYATFAAPEKPPAAGTAITLGEGYTIAAPKDGDLFAGVLTHAEESGYALVQLKGYVRVPYTGTAPAYGYTALVCDAAGKVKIPATSAAGRYVLVCDVDATAGLVGIILL